MFHKHPLIFIDKIVVIKIASTSLNIRYMKKILMLEEYKWFFFIKYGLTWVQVHVCTGKWMDTEITGIRESLCLLLNLWVSNIPRYFYFALSSAYTPLRSRISGMNILCILRFAKNCTRENKVTTFDHKIAKFDTRENFRLYGSLFIDVVFSRLFSRTSVSIIGLTKSTSQSSMVI